MSKRYILVYTLIVSHGALSLVYSFVDDSMRNAYFPLDSRTLSIPSLVELTNTCGLDDMNSHILEYTEIFELLRKAPVDARPGLRPLHVLILILVLVLVLIRLPFAAPCR